MQPREAARVRHRLDLRMGGLEAQHVLERETVPLRGVTVILQERAAIGTPALTGPLGQALAGAAEPHAGRRIFGRAALKAGTEFARRMVADDHDSIPMTAHVTQAKASKITAQARSRRASHQPSLKRTRGPNMLGEGGERGHVKGAPVGFRIDGQDAMQRDLDLGGRDFTELLDQRRPFLFLGRQEETFGGRLGEVALYSRIIMASRRRVASPAMYAPVPITWRGPIHRWPRLTRTVRPCSRSAVGPLRVVVVFGG